ncbi:MAG: glycosyltransferase family 2 protein [Lachnospiraceae bacterium]|nr:glycosyltransferase family 2 protein [Lachnospiraceae bacterium]
MTDFSIITVTYNSENTLKRAMDSVINQTYPPKEYFIVDGKSTDRTIEIAESYIEIAKEKGINLIISSEPDNGIYDAMNKGIRKCSCEIIGMINSDDYYELDALEKVKKVYESKGFDIFYADIRMCLKDGKSFIKKARSRSYMTSRDWNHPTTFITRKTYENNLYKTETIHDDYDLILRLKKNGAKVEVLNEVIANFTMNGVSHERDIRKMVDRIQIKYKIYRQNGYSCFYIIECLMVEIAKFIVG